MPSSADPAYAEVVTYARSLLGVKWRHQGRSPEKGVDCAGLVILSGKHAGLLRPDFDFLAYRRYPDGQTLVRLCAENADPVAYAHWQPGDFVVMRDIGDSRWPCHMGILFHGPDRSPWMVHSYARRPILRVVENPFEGQWRDQMVRCFRFRRAA